ncbi:low temperature requirement protein A [Actinomadura sp. 6N118]|uniref:low temperature requirement protein A n=1 Tax=Actinomadura sp. 6N118 TaxID=3375151 RepID=UPI00379C131B
MQLTIDPARREVTPLELISDLVYVFAIGQQSHRLLAHRTWTGAAQTPVLYLAVYAAWAYTTWAFTPAQAADPRTQRMPLAAVIAIAIVVALAAFENRRPIGDTGAKPIGDARAKPIGAP